jgi:hypothetical protein
MKSGLWFHLGMSPDPKPAPGPVQTVVESITQVLHIIRFPVPDMVDAIQGSLRALLGMQKDKAGIFEGAPMTIQMSFGRMVNNILVCGGVVAGVNLQADPRRAFEADRGLAAVDEKGRDDDAGQDGDDDDGGRVHV